MVDEFKFWGCRSAALRQELQIAVDELSSA